MTNGRHLVPVSPDDSHRQAPIAQCAHFMLHVAGCAHPPVLQKLFPGLTLLGLYRCFMRPVEHILDIRLRQTMLRRQFG